MIKKIFLFWMVLITMSWAGSWYIETDGSDANTGKSWAQSMQTIAALNDSISRGDSVYFGSGEWLDSQIIPPAGTSEIYTVYSCSTGTLEYAHTTTIWSGAELTDWIVHNDSLWKTEWNPSEGGGGHDSYPCIVGEDLLYKCVTSVGAMVRSGYTYYDYADDTLYIHPYEADDPDVTGERILASYKTGVVWFGDGLTRYTKFFGLDLKMGHAGTIYFDANWKHDFNTFVHCNIAHNTTGTANNSSVIYMGGYGTENPDTLLGYSYGNSFVACSIYSSNSDITESSSHAGSGVTFYGMRQNVFDSCYFKMLPGSGVMWKGGGLEYYGNRVSFCTFDGTDSMAYGQPTFTNYVVEHACGASKDSVYGNLFMNLYHSTTSVIGIPTVECGAPTHYCGGDFIANNTAYNCNTFFFINIDWAETTGCEWGRVNSFWKYNVLQRVINNTRWIHDGPGTLFDRGGWAEVDSNLWYDVSGGENFKYYNGTMRYWVDWQSIYGNDVYGDTVSAGFNDPENGDFTRPGAPQEMYVFYAGRWWYNYGREQNNYATITRRGMFLR